MILTTSIILFFTILCYNIIKSILSFIRKDKIQKRLNKIQNKLK